MLFGALHLPNPLIRVVRDPLRIAGDGQLQHIDSLRTSIKLKRARKRLQSLCGHILSRELTN